MTEGSFLGQRKRLPRGGNLFCENRTRAEEFEMAWQSAGRVVHYDRVGARPATREATRETRRATRRARFTPLSGSRSAKAAKDGLDGTGWHCAPWSERMQPLAARALTNRERCYQQHHTARDGFAYMYNEGRGTERAACGQAAACWCCRRSSRTMETDKG